MLSVPNSAVDMGRAVLPVVSDSWRDVVVIVRVYNEAPVVGGVISQLTAAGLAVIAVDDASTDASAAEIDKAGAFRVTHPVNLGAGGALQTGYEAALRGLVGHLRNSRQ